MWLLDLVPLAILRTIFEAAHQIVSAQPDIVIMGIKSTVKLHSAQTHAVLSGLQNLLDLLYGEQLADSPPV